MKGRSILGLVVGLGVLGVGWLPVFAQSQRYPTPSEMQRLRQQFRQSIRSIQNDPQRFDYIRDRRNQQELQDRESFVRDWRNIDPSIASFLGGWRGSERRFSIYPSTVKSRVCIISNNEDSINFYVGNISNGQIRTNANQLIFIEGQYLGIAVVVNNQPRFDEIFLNNPIPLWHPRTFQTMSGKIPESILQQFNAADCTAFRPNRR